MSDRKLNLRQKLVEIRKTIDFIQKTEKGNQGAQYIDVAVLLKKVREEMNKLGVLLSPAIESASVTLIDQPSKNNKDKQDHLCAMPMSMTWIDADSDEIIKVPWFATGSHMTDPAMAMGGSLTYTVRYFLVTWFQIPTSKDDPELFEQKTTDYVSNAQVSELQELVNSKGFPVNATLQAFASKRMNVQNIWSLPANKFNEAKGLIDALEPKKEATEK